MMKRADQRPRSATQRDVADLAGVSVATVSYVVSGRRDRRSAATPEVVRRVQAAAAELDYRPQRAGRVLRRNKTDVIGIAAPNPLTPWAQEVAIEVDAVAQRRALNVITVNHSRNVEQSDRTEQLLVDGIVDAAVVLAPERFGIERLDRLAGAGLPVLAIGPETAIDTSGRRWDALIEGQTAGFGPAISHLIDGGIHQLAFIAESSVDDPKVTAFRNAIDELGIDADAIEIVEVPAAPATSALDTHSAIRALLARPPASRPQALLTGSDRAAIAAMWTAIDLDLEVPADVAIIGAGNIAEGRAVRPQLSTVGSDPVAYQPAIEHLLDRIEDPSLQPQRTIIPWRLITRGTTRP